VPTLTPPSSFPGLRRADLLDRDGLDAAIDRVTGARATAGNQLHHHPDSAEAIEAMLELIARGERWVHFENYIVRDDHTGHRFADALAERALAGVRVRVLYDAFGSLGTPSRYWRRLEQAGVEVRAFHPLFSQRPLDVIYRDHRKLVVADGARAITGGLCIGDEWGGDASRSRRPWRDTMVSVVGPAAAALDRTFARMWARAGPPLSLEELEADPVERGPSSVRAVSGAPGRAHMYRAVQLLAASARQRLWITDAYLVAPPPLYAALLDAARDGVDVRLLVPSTSDLPVLRNFTRVGYRDLLHAGARVFEWRGPMLHAKTFLVDRRWARVGSSNLNFSSLLGNYELDLLADCDTLAAELAQQFLRDLMSSREIVLQARRRFLPPRLVGAPATALPPPPEQPHRRSRYELGTVAVVTLRRVAGGVRRTMAVTAALGFLAIGVLALAFPRAASIALAAAAFVFALGAGAYMLERRRARGDDDGS
jgi:cardiolipin synthase